MSLTVIFTFAVLLSGASSPEPTSLAMTVSSKACVPFSRSNGSFTSTTSRWLEASAKKFSSLPLVIDKENFPLSPKSASVTSRVPSTVFFDVPSGTAIGSTDWANFGGLSFLSDSAKMMGTVTDSEPTLAVNDSDTTGEASRSSLPAMTTSMYSALFAYFCPANLTLSDPASLNETELADTPLTQKVKSFVPKACSSAVALNTRLVLAMRAWQFVMSQSMSIAAANAREHRCQHRPNGWVPHEKGV